MATKQVSATEFKARCLRIIQEINRDGGTVTVTSRGRPVAIVSRAPETADQPHPLLGGLRGTVLRYDEPFEPVGPPSDWAALG